MHTNPWWEAIWNSNTDNGLVITMMLASYSVLGTQYSVLCCRLMARLSQNQKLFVASGVWLDQEGEHGARSWKRRGIELGWAVRIPLKAFLHICITFSWRGMWRAKRREAKIYIESSVKITMQTVDGRGGRRHENKWNCCLLKATGPFGSWAKYGA